MQATDRFWIWLTAYAAVSLGCYAAVIGAIVR
jgi:hypothetical protein